MVLASQRPDLKKEDALGSHKPTKVKLESAEGTKP